MQPRKLSWGHGASAVPACDRAAAKNITVSDGCDGGGAEGARSRTGGLSCPRKTLPGVPVKGAGTRTPEGAPVRAPASRKVTSGACQGGGGRVVRSASPSPTKKGLSVTCDRGPGVCPPKSGRQGPLRGALEGDMRTVNGKRRPQATSRRASNARSLDALEADLAGPAGLCISEVQIKYFLWTTSQRLPGHLSIAVF